MSNTWHSPGSIYNLGHRAVADLLAHPLQVQEKVDGSFFAFGVFGDDRELRCRSKGAMIYPDAPPAMFKAAVETARELASSLVPDWTYRGEVLAKPRHNALSYDRVPNGNIILFDIVVGEETFMNYRTLRECAETLGLEVVPQLGTFDPHTLTPDHLRSFLETTSILGGQKIEGVVLKPLVPLFGIDKKFLMAKYVSENFREVHKQTWKGDNPTSADILTVLGQRYGTKARWNKAIQHLLEAGVIAGDTPRDIGPLMKEVPQDILKEEEDAIKEDLFKWAWPQVARMTTHGLPEYYKERLLAQQFAYESRNPVIGESVHE